MIYYKHYIGDYQRHTGHLTLAQDGAYRRLMDHYYSTEEPLPADPSALYRICGAMEKAERQAVDSVVKQFFTTHEGRLHHQRVDEEISIAQEKIANLKENAANGGKQSGKARASKKEANASPNAQANASNNRSKSEANDEAKTNNKSVVSSQTKPNGLENITLPAWLDQDLWDEWVDYRKGIKARLTLKAAELCIAKLEALRREGNDPRKVIENTIMSGKWTGLFAIKGEPRAGPGKTLKFDPVAFVNQNRVAS